MDRTLEDRIQHGRYCLTLMPGRPGCPERPGGQRWDTARETEESNQEPLLRDKVIHLLGFPAAEPQWKSIH